MRCRHDDGLAARWDYISADETSATGWIVCRSCKARLERVTIAGGTFRGQGRHLDLFREQILHDNTLADLRELEVD